MRMDPARRAGAEPSTLYVVHREPAQRGVCVCGVCVV